MMLSWQEMVLAVLVGYLAGLYTMKFLDFREDCKKFDRGMEKLRREGQAFKESSDVLRGKKDV